MSLAPLLSPVSLTLLSPVTGVLASCVIFKYCPQCAGEEVSPTLQGFPQFTLEFPHLLFPAPWEAISTLPVKFWQVFLLHPAGLGLVGARASETGPP